MSDRALEHVRAVVLTQAWSGAVTTQLLADMGADVIQVEPLPWRRLDSWRGPYLPQDAAGAYPNDDPGERPYNRRAIFNTVNRNKHGITLNLDNPEGRELFLRLVETADVVAENYSSRVLGNLDLEYPVLRAVNPSIILLRMPTYGCNGPYTFYPGNGGSTEPMTGNSYLLGYEDGPPLNSGIMYTDPVAGVLGFGALLVALHHRHRTGEGQFIDLSQQETGITVLGDQILEYTLAGHVPQRGGNLDPWMAPHGNYRCRGEDAWVAIAVRSDAEWERLCQVAGRPEWNQDPRLADMIGRRRHTKELDGLVEAWTRELEPAEITELLQGVGIPAAPVLTAEGVMSNPQLQARDFFEMVHHPEAGSHPMPGMPWKLSRTPGSIRMPAPCVGEHSRPVLKRLLGLEADYLARLEEQGVTGQTPPFPIDSA